jgi:hypothetical protein
MKNLIYSLLLINSNLLIAQNNNFIIAVAADYVNILYPLVDNPLTIAVSEISAQKLFAKVDQGQISGENGKYIVRPTKAGELNLFLYRLNKKDTIALGKYRFIVKNIPDPYFSLCGFYIQNNKTKIGRSTLFASPFLRALNYEDFIFKYSFEVTSFQIRILEDDKEIILISNSSEMTDEMLNVIRTSNSNELILENIRVSFPDNSERIYKESYLIQFN